MAQLFLLGRMDICDQGDIISGRSRIQSRFTNGPQLQNVFKHFHLANLPSHPHIAPTFGTLRYLISPIFLTGESS